MPGLPLFFTDTGATPDLVYTPLPGLYLGDDTFLGDGIWLDEGSSEAFGPTPVLAEEGIVLTVTPVPAVAIQTTVTLPAGDMVISVVPVPALAFGGVIGEAGQDIVLDVDPPVPAVAFMPIPQTSGGLSFVVIPSVRELPPLRLHVDVETPGGRHFRWGLDEPDPANVYSSLRFSDTMPGGFENFDCTLPRKPSRNSPDLEPLSTLTVVGAGGQVVWEGRKERSPAQSGDQRAVTPSAVGFQADLDDDKSAKITYVDGDLSKWRGPGITRQYSLAASGASLGDASVEPDLAGAGLKLAFSGEFPTGAGPRSESYYDAGPGARVAAVFADWATNAPVGTGAGAWTLVPFMTDDETNFFEAGTDQLTGATSASSFFYTPATPRRMVMVQLGFLATPSGADGVEYAVTLKNVRVFGDHGLTIRGLYPQFGFYASDVVAHAVGRWAPRLRFSVGQYGSIRPSGFLIEQLAFNESTTAGEIVRQASRFGLQDWGVWDDRTFWWAERGAIGRTWRARVGPAQLEETGQAADRIWNSISVSYQDADGSTKTVGPPGSGSDVEDALLVDSDPENPANRAGLVRRDLLSMGTSTAAGAIEVGRRFLAEAKLLDHSGRARFVGHVESDKGVVHPYFSPRAGDQVVFVDAADQSPRRIVRTDKDHSSRTCTIDLDAPPEGLQALLERLGVVLVPLGF